MDIFSENCLQFNDWILNKVTNIDMMNIAERVPEKSRNSSVDLQSQKEIDQKNFFDFKLRYYILIKNLSDLLLFLTAALK